MRGEAKVRLEFRVQSTVVAKGSTAHTALQLLLSWIQSIGGQALGCFARGSSRDAGDSPTPLPQSTPVWICDVGKNSPPPSFVARCPKDWSPEPGRFKHTYVHSRETPIVLVYALYFPAYSGKELLGSIITTCFCWPAGIPICLIHRVEGRRGQQHLSRHQSRRLSTMRD